MCKLLIAKGSFRRATVDALLSSSARTFGASQRDGFGFAALGADGTIARGRYLIPGAYRGFRTPPPAWIQQESAEEGRITALTVALVVHGRTATNRVSVANVHPFRAPDGDSYLAHNGILTWRGDGPSPESDDGCDSDAYHRWHANHPDPWGASSAHWAGYGVLGIIHARERCLIVAKCRTGSLHWCGTGTAHIFATTSPDCAKFARIAGVKDTRSLPVVGGVRIEFAPVGDGVTVTDWAGFGARASDALTRLTRIGHGDGDTPRHRRNRLRGDAELSLDWTPREAALP